MHSRSSNIGNKSLWKRGFFTHKGCSLTPQFSPMWLLRWRQDGGHSCSLAAADNYSWDYNKVADTPQPAFHIPEPETMKNNDGQTPRILSVVLPAFCTAGVDCGQQYLAQLLSAQPGLGLSLGSAQALLLHSHGCFLHRCRGTHSVGLWKKQNKMVNFWSISPFFLPLEPTPLAWCEPSRIAMWPDPRAPPPWANLGHYTYTQGPCWSIVWFQIMCFGSIYQWFKGSEWCHKTSNLAPFLAVAKSCYQMVTAVGTMFSEFPVENCLHGINCWHKSL